MICLTYDTDYMTQDSLEKFLRDYPIPGKGTFFTHEYFPILELTPHEVCPHPFIKNLSGWEESVTIISKHFSVKPKGIRPHSCVFSHMIGIGMNDAGYSYVSQAQNLFQASLKPFRHPWGIWELPIYYMDNMDFWMSKNWPEAHHVPFNPSVIKQAVSNESLYVFDIHPLHIALNTRSHEDYCAVKDRVVKDGVSPFELRFPGRGVAVFYEELYAAIENSGTRSFTCSEALKHYGCI